MNTMRRSIFIIIGILLGCCLILFCIFVFYKFSDEIKLLNNLTKKALTMNRQLQIDASYSNIETLTELGQLKIGGKMPYGPGDGTFAPILEIPESKFYVFMAGEDWCILGDCGIEGELVQTMGGWLGGENFEQPEVYENFGLEDNPKKYNSVTIVGDANERIVGIYPNTNITNLFIILKQHSNIIDFNSLKGVDSFGPLKVGRPSPIRPGDFLKQFEDNESVKTGYILYDESDKKMINHLPKDKKFYIFGFEKSLMEKPFCAYLYCFEAGQFEYTQELGCWFSGTNDYKTIEEFGLNSLKVSMGEQSLIVVTDQDGIIVAIHPNKTKHDVMSVLWQLPQLTVVE